MLLGGRIDITSMFNVMNNIILHVLQQHKQTLLNKYPIKSLALFGSQNREDFTNESDVDILVEINGKKSYKFFHLN